MSVTGPQVSLLESYGLIEDEGGVLTTAFPVLGPGQISAVRHDVRARAGAALAAAASCTAELVDALATDDLEGSAFAMVFGHSLDGILWDLLDERGDRPPTELTPSHPHWRGVFWAVYPGRPGSAGTNELREAGASLVMVWDDSSADALRELGGDPAMRGWLDSLEPSGAKAMLTTRRRQRAVPVVGSHGDGPVSAASLRLGAIAADAIPGGDECSALLDRHGVAAEPGAAVVIYAHELIWELAEQLIATGRVSAPRAGDHLARLFVRVDH
jgi:hypothetical protein